jgi:hypothetical protein
MAISNARWSEYDRRPAGTSRRDASPVSVLEHAHAVEDVRNLEAAAQAHACDLVGRLAGDILAVQENATGGHRVKPRHQVIKRRLAGAIGSDDGMNPVFFDGQLDAADVQVLELDRARGHRAALALTSSMAVP